VIVSVFLDLVTGGRHEEALEEETGRVAP